MKTITRTEITVETTETVAMKTRGWLIQSWCARCSEQAGMIRLEEAALAGMSLQAICRHAGDDRLHLLEVADGLSLLCLNSILNSLSKEKDNATFHTTC